MRGARHLNQKPQMPFNAAESVLPFPLSTVVGNTYFAVSVPGAPLRPRIDRRDEATNTRPNTKQYGTFDAYHRPGRPPWDGAVTTGLRDAVEQCTAVWLSSARAASAPSRPAGRAVHAHGSRRSPAAAPAPAEPCPLRRPSVPYLSQQKPCP